MKIHGNIRKHMNIDHFHEFAFIVYLLTCILNVWTCFFTVFCVFVVFGPIQKDARRKTMHLGGTQTSRSLTVSWLVSKTMNWIFDVWTLTVTVTQICSVPPAPYVWPPLLSHTVFRTPPPGCVKSRSTPIKFSPICHAWSGPGPGLSRPAPELLGRVAGIQLASL